MTKAYFDPETCETCGEAGRVVDSRKYPGYRRQRYACSSSTCDARWTAYKSRVHPLQALEASQATTVQTSHDAPALASPPAPVAPIDTAPSHAPRMMPSRRVARSPYLR